MKVKCPICDKVFFMSFIPGHEKRIVPCRQCWKVYMHEDSLEKVDEFIKTCGGLTEVYQQSRAQFDYSLFKTDDNDVPPLEKAKAYKQIIIQLEQLHYYTIMKRDFYTALVTKCLLQEIIEKLGKAIEETKNSQEK